MMPPMTEGSVSASPSPRAVSISRSASRPLRILFVLRAANFDRMFERLIRGLLARGHTIHVVAEGSKRLIVPGFDRIFDALSGEYSTFSFKQMDGPPRESWLTLASVLRRGIDYLRFLEPEFAEAVGLHERARSNAPMALRFLMRWRLFRGPRVRHGIDRILRALEAALPASKVAGELVDGEHPDLVLLAPFVGLGEGQADYLRAAQARGIPVVLPVASWDNLTNKGVMRDTPELTIVWNAIQVREAVELHGLPPERVLATGAHSFDHWFEWKRSRDRAEFLETVGLPDRPFLMYVCSSSFIAAQETEFVDEWIRRLRNQAPPELAEVGVLIRPHPQNTRMWHEHMPEDPWAVVWPDKGAVPSDEQTRIDYYDSLHHSAAVVGINTSALIEAAIARRPVFTIRRPEHRHSQSGTVHFAYLTGENGGGVLRAADDWDEHFAQLAAELNAERRPDERIERFLVDFLRPHGLDRPATPFAVGAIEQAVDRPRVERQAPGLLARLTVKALVLFARPIGAFTRWLRRSRLWLWIAAKRARDHRDAERARKAIEMARRRRVRRRRRFTTRLRSTFGIDSASRKDKKPKKPPEADKAAKPKKAPKPAKAEKAVKPSKAAKPAKAEKMVKPKTDPAANGAEVGVDQRPPADEPGRERERQT